MHTGKPTHVLLVLELGQTDGALVGLLLLLLSLPGNCGSFGELMWEGVAFNALSARSSRYARAPSSLDETNILLE